MAAITLARQGRWVAAQIFVSVVCLASSIAEEPPKKIVRPPETGAPPLPRDFLAAESKFSDVRVKAYKNGVFADAMEETKARGLNDLYIKGMSDPAVMPAIVKARQVLRNDLINTFNAPQPNVHVWLRQYLFTELQKVVADDKLPMVARVNALGMIGDLNQKEVTPPPPNPPNPAAPPQPLAAATPYLLGVFDNAKTPSALRVVALRGLLRHAQLGLPNKADVPAVETAMLTAVQATNVPMDCSEPAHEWMRRRAVEILGALKSANAAQVIIDIVADANLSLAFRCEAARSLGHLDLKQGDPAVGNAAAAQRLGDLAATVAETVADRRALHEYLDGVRIGLNGTSRDLKTAGGVRAATPQADVKLAGDVFALVEPIAKQIDPNNRSFKDDNLPATMEDLAKNIRQLGIAAAPPPAKAKPKTPEAGKGKEAKTAEPAKAQPGKAKTAKPDPE